MRYFITNSREHSMVMLTFSNNDIEQLKSLSTFLHSCKLGVAKIQLPRVGLWHITAIPSVLREVFPMWKAFDSFLEISEQDCHDIIARMGKSLPKEENFKDSTSHPNGNFGCSWAQPMEIVKEQWKAGVLMRDNFDKGNYMKDVDCTELLKQL